jgi:hypothetical protein
MLTRTVIFLPQAICLAIEDVRVVVIEVVVILMDDAALDLSKSLKSNGDGNLGLG